MPIDGAGGKTTFPILSLPRSHTHTPLSLSLLPSLSLCLPLSSPLTVPQHLGATGSTDSEGRRLFTHGSSEWRRANTQRRIHTHSHTHARGENGRWTEAPAVACPLAAVRHVGGGGGALLTVPCPLQSSKHLPSSPHPPERLLPGSAVAEGAGWNDPGERETQGDALDGAAYREDSLILDPSSSPG